MTCTAKKDCTKPVTHIGNKGYVYCDTCAVYHSGQERTRKMRGWELQLVEAGKPIPSYAPRPKAAVSSGA
jgi:hypothetical protein